MEGQGIQGRGLECSRAHCLVWFLFAPGSDVFRGAPGPLKTLPPPTLGKARGVYEAFLPEDARRQVLDLETSRVDSTTRRCHSDMPQSCRTETKQACRTVS